MTEVGGQHYRDPWGEEEAAGCGKGDIRPLVAAVVVVGEDTDSAVDVGEDAAAAKLAQGGAGSRRWSSNKGLVHDKNLDRSW